MLAFATKGESMSQVHVPDENASSRDCVPVHDVVKLSAQESHERGLTRRHLLIGGSTLVGLVALGNGLAPPARAAEATPTRLFVGKVVRVVSRTLLRLQRVGGTRVTLAQLAPSKEGRPFVDAAHLEVGEEIVAEGDWANGQFYADMLVPMCRAVEARVVERQDHVLVTESGKVLLTSATQPDDSYAGRALSPDRVGAGSVIAVMGRMDPRTGYLVASRISDTTRLP